MSSTIAQRVVTADGAAIHIEDWGNGPPLVFTHGWSAGCEMWEYQMTSLSESGYRCVGVDRRGCGRSTYGRRAIDLDQLADDLASVLEQVDLGDVTLVAHSVAAAEAIRMLTRHGSGRVSRLVLVAPTTPAILQSDDNPDGVPASVYEDIVRGLRKDKPAYLFEAAPAFFGGPDAVSPELLTWGVELAARASLRTSIDLIHVIAHADVRAELPAITTPTLVVHGDADQSAPLEICGRRTAAGISGSQLQIYEGAPHGIPLAAVHKDRLAADIERFIDRVT
jgi:pimeloyl-ACP methyl ester carboxylesterase